MNFVPATKLVFKDGRLLGAFILIILALMVLLLYLPIKFGGNRFDNLSLISGVDILLFLTLSILTSLSLVFNWYLIWQSKEAKFGLALFGQGGASLISSLFASIFTTATCAACATFLFGIIGVSGVFFLVDYRLPITLIAITLLLFSLYFTSQKVLGVCKVCKI